MFTTIIAPLVHCQWPVVEERAPEISNPNKSMYLETKTKGKENLSMSLPF